MEAEFEATEDLHHAWKMKARDVLAKAEWRRRKLNKRVGISTSCQLLHWSHVCRCKLPV